MMLQLAAYLDPTQTDLICSAGRGSTTINMKSVSFRRTQQIDLMYSTDEYTVKLLLFQPACYVDTGVDSYFSTGCEIRDNT